MADFVLAELIAFGVALEIEFPEEVESLYLKSQEAREKGAAFLGNVSRVAMLIRLPFRVAGWAQAAQVTLDLAKFNLTGTVISRRDQPIDPNILAKETQRLWNTRNDRVEGTLQIAVNGQAADVSPDEAAAFNLTGILAGQEAPDLRTGLQAFLAALMIASYTAFECLCADLWVSTVNSRPKTLAKYVLEPRPGKKGKEDRQQEPNLPYSEIAKHDFDVSKVMGTILVDRSRVRFESFNDIQEAYLRTFRLKDSPDLRSSNIISQMFTGAEKDIRSLEEIRNLLVHRGGIVDQRFLDHLGKTSIPPEMAEEKKHLHINGRMVATYAGAALRFSKTLLMGVDDWLAANPD